MNIERYVQWTRDYWHKQTQGEWQNSYEGRMTHALQGLTTETAEIVDLFKKMWFTPSRMKKDLLDALEDESGDLLHYWARVLDENGLDPIEVMKRNIDKIEARYG
jgi:NTP pyrophosphatase (non-canonical NTP hydrolase)